MRISAFTGYYFRQADCASARNADLSSGQTITSGGSEEKMQQSRNARLLIALAAAIGCGSIASAADVVNDTWRDGTRDDPASPTYSENGVDVDLDGDIESAWFRGGGGTLSVANANPGSGPGLLTAEISTSSSSITTYFTPEASPVTLATAGDQLRLTWIFSLSGTNLADTSQSFRMALVDSPGATRVSGEASPGDGTYAGYAIFGNMAQTLGNTNPFQLRERTAPGTASALLSAAASWTSLDDEENSGVTGYIDGTTYTLQMTLTRTALDELDILATMSGGNIGGDGQLTVAFLDTTPNSFTFDTFQLRPSTAASTANVFATSQFRVEYIPEPASAMLLAGALAAVRRRRS
jgi:hypothetical protein